MKTGRIRTVGLGLVILLIAASNAVSGCSDTNKSTRSTSPATVPRETAPQAKGTAPSPSTGTSNSEAAIAQAKAEGKPVLVKFGSGQCIPCKQIEENINKIKPEYEGKVAFVIVDVYDTREQGLTNQYGIQTIPTTYFLGRDGAVVNKVVGVMETGQLKRQLDSML